jgi:hypothetical protein
MTLPELHNELKRLQRMLDAYTTDVIAEEGRLPDIYTDRTYGELAYRIAEIKFSLPLNDKYRKFGTVAIEDIEIRE